jgi:hypothetical protein
MAISAIAPNLTDIDPTASTFGTTGYTEIFDTAVKYYNREPSAGFTQTPACGWVPTYSATYTKKCDVVWHTKG